MAIEREALVDPNFPLLREHNWPRRPPITCMRLGPCKLVGGYRSHQSDSADGGRSDFDARDRQAKPSRPDHVCFWPIAVVQGPFETSNHQQHNRFAVIAIDDASFRRMRTLRIDGPSFHEQQLDETTQSSCIPSGNASQPLATWFTARCKPC